MKTRHVRLAYAAGVIDSDGCILIARSHGHQYWERISVEQREPAGIQVLANLFGGQPRIRKRVQTTTMCVWAIQGRQAHAALAALLPYLQIKRQQAENALQVRKLVDTGKLVSTQGRGTGHGRGHQKRPADISEALERIWLYSKALHHLPDSLLYPVV